MIEHEYSSLFWDDSVHKDLVIKTDDSSTVITNTELHENAFEISESIISGDSIKFGNCVASSVKFTASNIYEDIKGKWLTITTSLKHDYSNPFQIGRFKVYSDVPTADRRKREIVAYDALYDILKADVAEWYNALLPSKSSTVTLKDFRTSFLSHFGIEQEDVDLPNDEMTVEKTIEPTELSGKTVINAICEINGCFGHIGRDGKFKYVFLKRGEDWLYPSNDLYPSENLYPKEGDQVLLRTGVYIPEAKYENFVTEKITGLQIRGEENDIGATAGDSGNVYVIQDNFLVYGKGNDELTEIAENILSVIKDIVYRPFSTKAKGNPCVEVGDPIRLNSKNQIIDSYVLQRVLRGVQALRDTYTAEGTQYQESKANSVKDQIIQLKAKTNVLTRTVDETRSELTNLENNTSTKFTQTAEQINAVATKTDENSDKIAEVSLTAEGLSSKVDSISGDIEDLGNDVEKNSTEISQTAEDISALAERTTTVEETVSSHTTKINQNAEQISAVAKNVETVDGKVSKNTAAIGVNSESIKAEVTRATDAERTLSGRIDLTATSVYLGVTNNADNTSASIRITLRDKNGDTVDYDTGDIELTGLVSFSNLENKAEKTFINGDNIITGTLVVGKNVTMGPNASISWSKVDNKPEDLAYQDDIPDDDYITQITKDTITSSYIKGLKLEVGNEILMGENAKISWTQITEQPNIPTEARITEITETAIKTTDVTAENLKVKVANIDGKITAGQIELQGITIGTAEGDPSISAIWISANKLYGFEIEAGNSIGTNSFSCDSGNAKNFSITMDLDIGDSIFKEGTLTLNGVNIGSKISELEEKITGTFSIDTIECRQIYLDGSLLDVILSDLEDRIAALER